MQSEKKGKEKMKKCKNVIAIIMAIVMVVLGSESELVIQAQEPSEQPTEVVEVTEVVVEEPEWAPQPPVYSDSTWDYFVPEIEEEVVEESEVADFSTEVVEPAEVIIEETEEVTEEAAEAADVSTEKQPVDVDEVAKNEELNNLHEWATNYPLYDEEKFSSYEEYKDSLPSESIWEEWEKDPGKGPIILPEPDPTPEPQPEVVEIIIEKEIPVEKIVEVPVEVEKIIEVPVIEERIVEIEKIVEVPVEKIVEIPVLVETPKEADPVPPVVETPEVEETVETPTPVVETPEVTPFVEIPSPVQAQPRVRRRVAMLPNTGEQDSNFATVVAMTLVVISTVLLLPVKREEQ